MIRLSHKSSINLNQTEFYHGIFGYYNSMNGWSDGFIIYRGSNAWTDGSAYCQDHPLIIVGTDELFSYEFPKSLLSEILFIHNESIVAYRK